MDNHYDQGSAANIRVILRVNAADRPENYEALKAHFAGSVLLDFKIVPRYVTERI